MGASAPPDAHARGVAIFPLACVSYVLARDEVGNVTRAIDFETRDAAVTAQARFNRLLDRRELHAIAVASSPEFQAAISGQETTRLERLARANRLLLVVRGQEYGRRITRAVTARVPLVSGGHTIGAVIAQLPVDAATLARLSAPDTHGVRLVSVLLGGAAP